jgi:gentisate 1,2-dioxygenase
MIEKPLRFRMIVTRWQAPILPNTEEMTQIMLREGLDPLLEVVEPNRKMPDHRHPFTEIRVLLKGEMIFSVAGNQMLLRAGDRIEVPPNTRHAHHAQGQTACECLVAQRVA